MRKRNHENIAIVGRVCRALGERMASYNYAVERPVVHAPSPLAAESERALTLLHTRIGQYCRSGRKALLPSKVRAAPAPGSGRRQVRCERPTAGRPRARAL